jgi:lysophospholipase L1-like esterase
MKRPLPFLTLAVASLALTAMLTAQPAPSTAPVDASVPVPKRGNARFYELHASFLKRAKEGPVGLLFLGDSITEGWKEVPEVWGEYFGKYHPANFGIGGDRTQHVLWRIEDGELDDVRPTVVVLMLGTNNTGTNSGEEIAAADRRIVALVRAKLPEAKVLLLAIFPRGLRKNKEGVMDDLLDRRLEAIRIANAELAKLDDGRAVRFLDISAKFRGADGHIPSAIMPDQLHLSPAGYKIWAEAMQPLLADMMR